jgi:phosphosulfolactate synthase (CoM biosynthesis protein A)
MEVAKELGYDLVNGRFGKANVSYDMVDNIINHMKSQGLDVSYELDPKKFADDDSELMKNTVIRRVEKQKDNF